MYSDARAALQLLVDGFKLKPERDVRQPLSCGPVGDAACCCLASTCYCFCKQQMFLTQANFFLLAGGFQIAVVLR